MEKQFNNKENEKFTVTDSEGNEKVIYHNRAVTMDIVQFLIKPESEFKIDLYVLVAERGPESHDYKGLLNVPCGHLDWDETIEEGAVRELYEETGLLNENLHVFGVSSTPTNNRQNVQVVTVGVIELEKDQPMPELKGNAESTNPKWVLLDDLVKEVNEKGLQPEKWAFEHDFLILDTAKNYFGFGQPQEIEVAQ